MTIARKTLSWLALFFTSASIGMAQPSGDFGFAFDANDVPVWDLTGIYVAGEVPVAILHDTKGRLSGSGDALVPVGTDVVGARYTVDGSVSGGGQDTRAKFTVRFKGRDMIAGEVRSFNITLKYDLSVVAEDLLLVGTVKGNASYSGLGQSKVDEEVELPLPAGVDGSWAVVMNLLLLEKKLAGTGSIIVSAFDDPDLPVGFPEDRVLPADVRGNYKPETDTAKLKVNGVNEGKGSNVKLEFQTDALLPSYLNGKVLGQRVLLGQPN